MFSGLLVVFFVETSNQFFENSPHAVVIQPGKLFVAVSIQNRFRTQVDGWIQIFLNQRAENIRIDKSRNLVAEFELFQDLLNIRRKAVKIGFKVRFQLLNFGSVFRSFSVNGELLKNASPEA